MIKGILVVIPCGKAKIWKKYPDRGPTPARSAYTGAPFKVNKAYAEHFAERWVILSAKYGFIPPDYVIPGPYDVTFEKKSTDSVAVSNLRVQIKAQGLDRFDTVIGLGGGVYCAVVAEAFAQAPVRACFPFGGLPIWKAMAAVKRAIELGEPCPEFGKRR